MDEHRFDTFVKHLQQSGIHRRRFLWLGTALGLSTARVGIDGRAQDIAPAPTATVGTDDPRAGTSQTLPDHFCPPGPSGPWFPIIPSPDVAAATGIQWYGMQMDETGRLIAASFARGGREMSRLEVSRGGRGEISWTIEDGRSELRGAVMVDRASGEKIRVRSETNGQRYTIVDATDANDLVVEGKPPVLDRAQEVLLAQWRPFSHEVEGLLDVLAVTSDDSVAAGTFKCAAAGFLTAANCANLFWWGLTGGCYEGGKSLYEWGCA